MAMCSETGLSPSYAYKKGCRCLVCVSLKKEYTRREAPKAKQRTREWLNNHPGKRTEYHRKSIDKLWINRFGELQEKQKGVCAICKLSVGGMTNSKTRLSVDHCHKTGRIRGLLCGNCNVGLGHFKDNPIFLLNAIQYLKIKIQESGDVW